MSAVLGSYTTEMDASYAADFSREREPMKKRSRHPEYRRKGSAPTRVNGMHCRRNKRWTWGSGRGARMTNLRAFAGCLGLAVAALAANARAVTIDLVTIGNPGNPGNVIVSGTFGSVATTFSMARTETTNAQYVEFLNAVDSNGTNPFGLYNASMNSSIAGGITNTGTVPGSIYQSKAGAPTGAPTGTSYANMPVNFVTWFSAARFINWLNAGQQSGTSTLNSGVYVLGSATSGNIVAREAGATYFLPSQNEWYKSAFHVSGSTYTTFPTNSNTQPANTVATGSMGLSNAGNWGGAATWGSGTAAAPVNVDAYANAKSAYGLYGMWGNIAEFSDTAGTTSGNVLIFSGNYATTLANVNNWSSVSAGGQISSTFTTGAGFRVASSIVAPVPEPETITLAAFGIVGLCGANWLKRRRKPAALPAPAISA